MRRLAVVSSMAGITVLAACLAAGQTPSRSFVDKDPHSKHKATLAWTAPPQNDRDKTTHYNIYRTSASIKKGVTTCGKKWNKIGSVAAPTTQFTDETVGAGKVYCYSVTSVTARGESSQSFAATAVIPKP